MGEGAQGEPEGQGGDERPRVGAQDGDFVEAQEAGQFFAIVEDKERLVAADKDHGDDGDLRSEREFNEALAPAKDDSVALFVAAKGLEIATWKHEDFAAALEGLPGGLMGGAQGPDSSQEAVADGHVNDGVVGEAVNQLVGPTLEVPACTDAEALVEADPAVVVAHQEPLAAGDVLEPLHAQAVIFLAGPVDEGDEGFNQLTVDGLDGLGAHRGLEGLLELAKELCGEERGVFHRMNLGSICGLLPQRDEFVSPSW